MIYIFSGDNIYLRDQAADEFVNAFISKHGELSVEKLQGEDIELDEIANIVSSQPFLTDRRLFKISQLSANKPVFGKFVASAGNLSDSTDIILVENSLGSKIAGAKELKKQATVRDFSNLDYNGLRSWLSEYFTANQCSIEPNLIDYLINRVGENQLVLKNEAEKLALLKKIDKRVIDNMTEPSPATSIFNLLDSILAGQTAKAVSIYEDQRAQGSEPQKILGMITWQLVNLALVFNTPSSLQVDEAATRAAISPFVYRKTKQASSKLNKAKLLKTFDLAVRTDELIKTSSVSTDGAVKNLVIELTKL